jgi:putative serine protease PepD
MSTSTLTHRNRDLRPSDPRTRLALGGIAVAVLGGLVALGLAFLVGAVHTGARATTVIQPAAVSKASSSPAGTWAGVYRGADAGAVDITVQATTSITTPFGARTEQETALGSGFVLNGQGDIVTAEHVVAGATSISVAFENGVTRSATVLGKDDGSDVAVIHVDPAGLTLQPLPLGSSAALQVGDPLAVVGDPLGFDRSLSTGVVSAVDRTIEAPNGFEIAHSIQTDAALNPGNSGGPLLNTSGQVIAIADQIATGTNQFGGPSSSETSTGVGFAVPIDLIKDELVALEHGQTVSHAYLGVSTSETANSTAGVLIASVESGTPAAKAGLKAGDVIVAFNGAAIASDGDLIDALAASHPGQVVKLTVQRGSSPLTITVTLGTQPAQAPSS